MISAFSDSLMASGISGSTKDMTMKFLPDVGIDKEKQNQNYFLTWLVRFVNYRAKSRKTRFLRNATSFLGMLTSWNFAGLSLLTSEMNPENFRLIFQRLAIYRTICKMRKKVVC